MNPGFWKDRTVFITGHTGFKGSWLAFWLNKMGADVIGYSQPAKLLSFHEICGMGHKIKSFTGNTVWPSDIRGIISTTKPSVVFHMAAQAFVGESYREPYTTFATNVLGTANLLDAVRDMDYVGATLVITSDKCYNNYVSSVHKETDELGGDDPYSASKACTELVINSYRKSFSMQNLATVRAGNVIGGGDWGKERLVIDVVRSILGKQPIELRKPNAVRPWQFILDVLAGYITLAEELIIKGTSFSGAWNFGPTGSLVTVSDFVEMFLKEWGYESEWIDKSQESQYQESQILQLDCSKARDILGWIPKLTLPQSIHYTADWYKACYSHFNMTYLTDKQIEEYMEL